MTFEAISGFPARRRARRAIGAAAAAALAAGTMLGAAAARAQDKPLVIARSMDLDTLDPQRAFCDTCQIYVSAVYETLVGLGADNRTLVPNVAASWQVNGDQTVFTFALDPKATFADGSPVEAKDVKWTLERLKNLKGNPAFLMDGVTSIEAPDAETVVVTMAAPSAEFLGILTAPYTGVVNSDVAAANGAVADADAASKDQAEPWFLKNSAGSGPFVLASYLPDEELRLKANAGYWRTKPGVGEIVMRQTKDAVAQGQMLESGAADIAMQIDPDLAASIKNDAVTIKPVPSFNFLYVALSPGAKSLPKPMTPEVREAIGLALDYEGIIDFTLGGHGAKQAAPIPNGFPGTSELPAPETNVEKAKELLAKAGFEGVTLEAAFPSMNVYGVDLSILMQKVQQDLTQVGITLELQPLAFSVWREKLLGDGIPLTTAFYAPDYFGSAQYVQFFGIFEGSSWSKRSHADRAPGTLNPKEAELLKAALAAPAAKQDEAYHAIALEMIKDRIIIPVVSPSLILAYRNDVTGVRYSACCNLPLGELGRK